MPETNDIIYWPTLCGNDSENDAFWNFNQNWNTSTPTLSPCFQNTVLVWVPCAVFWVAVPVYVLVFRTRPCNHFWLSCSSKKNIVATLLPLLCSVMTFYVWTTTFSDHDRNTPADTSAFIVQFVTFVAVAVYTRWCFVKGVHTSGLLFTFWLLALTCETVTCISSTSETIFVSKSVLLALDVAAFLISCTADQKALTPDFTSTEKLPLLSSKSFEDNVPSGGMRSQSDSGTFELDSMTSGETENGASTGEGCDVCPRATASILSEAFFFWMTWPVFKSVRKPITDSDIWEVTEDVKTQTLFWSFFQQWKKEKKKHHDGNNKRRIAKEKSIPSLILALARANVWYLFSPACIMVTYVILSLLGPLLLGQLVEFVQRKDPLLWKGYCLATLLFVVSVWKTLGMVHHQDISQVLALRVTGILSSAIYRKALTVSSAARRATSVGAIVNLMAVDTQRLIQWIVRLNFIWACPVLVVLTMVFLWQQLGPSSLTGLAILLIIMPFNITFLAVRMKHLQREQMEKKDKRLKLMGQVLNGIKVLKLYAWEPYFERKLENLRKEELANLKIQAVYAGFLTAVFTATPTLMSLVCFATYTLTSEDHVLDATKTFVSLSLINIVYFPLSMLSQLTVFWIEALVSIKRIQKFLLFEDLENKHDSVTHEQPNEHAIYLRDCAFAWENSGEAYLKNITIKVPGGQLIGVVGTVGSGKTSLLSALMDEMVLLEGSAQVNGSIAFVSQQAWIQNMTLKDNILFTSGMDSIRYDRVLEACALVYDAAILPAGDLTEIGEKGINLSGGQKQRVSLARAVYNDADIYLLDDPLSAVDAKVGRHLFEQVIGPSGILRNKTRILVTHNLSWLPELDNIIVMKDGRITETGTFDELWDSNGAFAEFLKAYANKVDHKKNEEIGRQFKAFNGVPSSGLTGKAPQGKLVEEEATKTGFINPVVIKYLFKAAKCVYPCLFLVTTCFYVTVLCLSQLWLRDWSSSQHQNTSNSESWKTLEIRIGVYAALSILQVFGIFGVHISIALSAVTVALSVHGQICHRVLRSPMTFFETTPLGRIFNRFSRDLDVIDKELQRSLSSLATTFAVLVATLILLLYTFPAAAWVILPVMVVFVIIQRMYVLCACQLKRTDATRRSPVYALLSETLAGVQSIRSYQLQDQFIARMEKLLNRSQSAYYQLNAANRWLGINIQMIGNIIILTTAVFGVAQQSVSPSSLGMVLSLTVKLTVQLAVLVLSSCELESQTVSIERVKEYSELPSEAPWQIAGSPLPTSWPENGAITFWDYHTRYRPGLNTVLRSVQFKILPCEKVGVVGRTGSGKSSLTLALFRILEASRGFIEIDDQNIAHLGLHDIRGRISIIPQEPVLFSGSIRFNLDPAGIYLDQEIWNALKDAHLKDYVNSLPGKLQHVCDDDGGNMSIGQKQLMCFARAVLRKSKILILDEATATVDMETGDLVQSTVKSEFKSCTVITIAHRLNTVMDCDRVMVLDAGRIQEFDSPNNLLNDPTSWFSTLARDAKITG